MSEPMPARYAVPIDLDLRELPALETHVAVELDLPTLIAHLGEPHERVALGGVKLPDGKMCWAQVHVAAGASLPSLLLSLPANVAAVDQVQLTLIAEAGHGWEARPRIIFSQTAEDVEIRNLGAPVAVYHYNTERPSLPRPYFHPVSLPVGAPVTQVGEFPGTERGHFHHTGLFLAHQNFTDGNNWQIGPQFSRMRHVHFDVMESGPVAGRFVERLEWLNVKGDRAVFHEIRTVTVPARRTAQLVLDVDTTVNCGDQPATWNATPYHLLAIRLPDAMLVGRGGAILSSEGKRDREVDDQPARWLDYSGPRHGKTVGVALFDHPGNLRHPTRWLNFENQTIGAAPTHHEPYAWGPGESQRFRYRALVHEGDAKHAAVEQEYQAYAADVKARVGPPQRIA